MSCSFEPESGSPTEQRVEPQPAVVKKPVTEPGETVLATAWNVGAKGAAGVVRVLGAEGAHDVITETGTETRLIVSPGAEELAQAIESRTIPIDWSASKETELAAKLTERYLFVAQFYAGGTSNGPLLTAESARATVTLGELDSLGRATGAAGTLTPEMLGTGSAASASLRPPGFVSGEGFARGHLWGRQLGGPGNDPKNLVTLYQNPANHPVMSGYEAEIARALKVGQSVEFSATPVYVPGQVIPRAITIEAQGGDLNLGVSILNQSQ